jgi:sulfur carrier protein ThiS
MNPHLTLPELLKQTEKLTRQLAEHLNFDFVPKVQRLTTIANPNIAALAASEEFTVKLYRDWGANCKGIDQMSVALMQETDE